MPPPIELAWLVDPVTGCHVCTSHARNKCSYPKIKRNGKSYTANKYVYEEIHGPVAPGIVVRHT